MANTCTSGDLDLNPSYLSITGWLREGITRELSGGNKAAFIPYGLNALVGIIETVVSLVGMVVLGTVGTFSLEDWAFSKAFECWDRSKDALYQSFKSIAMIPGMSRQVDDVRFDPNKTITVIGSQFYLIDDEGVISYYT